jgi:hypothetical protein
LLGTLVWLSSVNDIHLVEDDALLPDEMCAAHDRATVRRVARVVHSLLREYSYVRSPEFTGQLAGKSAAFAEMKTRVTNEPAKWPPQRRRAQEALASLLQGDAAYSLFPGHNHEQLDWLRSSLNGLSNPA